MRIENKIKKIIESVLDIEDISKQIRKRKIVDGRKIFCYIMKNQSIYTLNEIGGFVDVDHATASYHIDKVETLIKTNKLFKKKYDMVMYQINTTTQERRQEAKAILEVRILKKEIILLKKQMIINKTLNYTPNELAYRQLSNTDKHNYNIRTSAILRMMNSEKRTEKSKFELINCQK